MEREKREDGHYRILPDIEKGETSLGMLRAMGLAAFGKAGIFYESETEMNELVREIDRSIHGNSDGLILEMGFKKGHQIKTTVSTDPSKNLTLSGHQYLRDHGESPENLLDRANEILKNNPILNTMAVEQSSASPTVLSEKGGIFKRLIGR